MFDKISSQVPIYQDVHGALIQADCLEILPLLPDQSVNLILADLPYGTTQCSWDSIIPIEKLWEQYARLLKADGAVVLTATQPFTSVLVNSKLDWFKYALVWEKERPSDPVHASHRFMKWHEDILVFGPKKIKFNPQKEKRLEKNKRKNKQGVRHQSEVFGSHPAVLQGNGLADERHLSSVLKVNVERGLHPTQKPTKLMKILISAFSGPNDVVLDNTMGVGTTCLAAKELGRRFIGIEKEQKYYDIAVERLS